MFKRQKEIGQFSAVKTVVLRDQEATAANIRLALSRLAGGYPGPLPGGAPPALEVLRPVRPEDALVLYFAGHGISDSDRFYLVPHDLGYTGPKAEISANAQARGSGIVSPHFSTFSPLFSTLGS